MTGGGAGIQAVDSVALLPAYVAAGTAVLVLLADLFVARRGATVAVAATGAAATALAAVLVGRGGARETFCVGADCSYLATGRSALFGALFALLTLGVLALSVPLLRAGQAPAGEYCFLLACSMTGGVVLGAAGDLITLIVALETLTLPLYVLVGLRRRSLASAEAAVTFFVVSVVATSVTLLGAALLYAVTGAVHLNRLGAAFAAGGGLLETPLAGAAAALVVLGLAFKVAAVPFHAWAPATYDGAPVPVAAYLSTASKLGGVVALLAVTAVALPATVTGPVLALLAVLSMTVGNLVALRQERMVRLLAWSSVAQAGYLVAPLGALALAGGRTAAAMSSAAAATVAYTVFYVVLELAAFGAVVALRPPAADGGSIGAYRGAARRRPLAGAALVLALVGLAGLPPGLAGLFAKVTIVRSLLDGRAGWLAVVVALNAVVGLAYYVRVAAVLYAPPNEPEPGRDAGVRPSWAVAAALGAASLIAIIVGFAPQLVLDLAAR
jgi:NADH-quinone oxidoreductase subunit N